MVKRRREIRKRLAWWWWQGKKVRSRKIAAQVYYLPLFSLVLF